MQIAWAFQDINNQTLLLMASPCCILCRHITWRIVGNNLLFNILLTLLNNS